MQIMHAGKNLKIIVAYFPQFSICPSHVSFIDKFNLRSCKCEGDNVETRIELIEIFQDFII